MKSLISSMTGFGRAEVESSVGRVVIEVRSVNHRYFDVEIRAPRLLRSKELVIRKMLSEQFRRGRLEVYITFEPSFAFDGVRARIDRPYAVAYHKALKELVEELGVNAAWEEAFLHHANEFISLDEEIAAEGATWIAVECALNEAIADLKRSRLAEGERLFSVMRECIDRVAARLSEIEGYTPSIVETFRSRLAKKLADLEPGIVDPARLATEVALLAERADITEEISRAKSHLEALRSTLESDDVAGRRMEFIVQELSREVNTMGSKANDYEVSRLVVDMKGELEKLREQAQNIE